MSVKRMRRRVSFGYWLTPVGINLVTLASCRFSFVWIISLRFSRRSKLGAGRRELSACHIEGTYGPGQSLFGILHFLSYE